MLSELELPMKWLLTLLSFFFVDIHSYIRRRDYTVS